MLPFLEQGPTELVIVNRTVTKAEELGRQFKQYGPITAIGYSALADKKLGRFDLVVNATSASLRGELPPISPEVFGDDCLAYELLYGKGLTPFLRLAITVVAGRGRRPLHQRAFDRLQFPHVGRLDRSTQIVIAVFDADPLGDTRLVAAMMDSLCCQSISIR